MKESPMLSSLWPALHGQPWLFSSVTVCASTRTRVCELMSPPYNVDYITRQISAYDTHHCHMYLKLKFSHWATKHWSWATFQIDDKILTNCELPVQWRAVYVKCWQLALLTDHEKNMFTAIKAYGTINLQHAVNNEKSEAISYLCQSNERSSLVRGNFFTKTNNKAGSQDSGDNLSPLFQ